MAIDWTKVKVGTRVSLRNAAPQIRLFTGYSTDRDRVYYDLVLIHKTVKRNFPACEVSIVDYIFEGEV